jgi:hypothetical protein
MKRLVFLLPIYFVSCSLLQEDSCDILTDGDLQVSNLEVPDYALYKGITGVKVNYEAGDCFMPTSWWTFPGADDEIEGKFEFDGQATSGMALTKSGDICVRLEFDGNSTSMPCKAIEVVKEDVWTLRNDLTFPGTKTNHHVTMSLSSGIYSGFGESNEWYRFDTDHWTWEEKSTPNLPAFEAYTGFEHDKTGYVFGQNGFMYRYDESTDQWTLTGEEFPGRLDTTFLLDRYAAGNDLVSTIYPFISAGYNSKAYIGIGGTGAFFRFDISAGTWSRMPSYPQPGIYNANHFVFQDKLYLGPYRFDFATERWEEAPSRYSHDLYDQGFAVMNDGVYFNSNNTTFKFDGSTTVSYEPRPIPGSEYRFAPGLAQGATFDGITYFPQSLKNHLFIYFVKSLP